MELEMDIQTRLQMLIGAQAMQIAALQVQLEEAQKLVDELKKPKPDSSTRTVRTQVPK